MDTGTHSGSAATGITTRLASAPSGASLRLQPDLPQHKTYSRRSDTASATGDHLKTLLHLARGSQDTALSLNPIKRLFVFLLEQKMGFFFFFPF